VNRLKGRVVIEIKERKKVLGAGVEPALVAQHAPQACASANSATRAAIQIIVSVHGKSNVFSIKIKKKYFVEILLVLFNYSTIIWDIF
jgi:hypothetical protein